MKNRRFPNVKEKSATVVAVFGGTFDPVHSGHIKLALSVIKERYADKILFVPSARPPHKIGISITPFHHRVNMLRLAIADYSNLEISTIEYERELKDYKTQFTSGYKREFSHGDTLFSFEPSYTLTTMRELKQLLQGYKLLFLMGTDSLMNLYTWHKADELVAECEFIIYPRPDIIVDFEKLIYEWDKKFIKTSNSTQSKQCNSMEKLKKSILTLPTYSISSTEIRRYIRQGKDIPDNVREYIIPKVISYIKANNLYRK